MATEPGEAVPEEAAEGARDGKGWERHCESLGMEIGHDAKDREVDREGG